MLRAAADVLKTDFLEAHVKANRFQKLNNGFQHAARMVALVLALGACTKGTVTGTGSSSVSGTISVSKVYPTASGSSWTPITSGSRYYIKGLNLTIEGTCSPGIATIKVDPGSGNYTETATCNLSGQFTWNRTYIGAEEGDITLTLTAYDVSDTLITGASASTQVRVDNTAPAAPVVTDPASTPYDYFGSVASYTIQGTVSADTVRLSGPASVTITPVANAWTYSATLVDGSSLGFTFYAYDLAGNQSTGTTQTINWAPSISVKFAGAYPATGSVTHGGTSYSAEVTAESQPSGATDGGTSYSILSGFNSVINKVRSD